MACSRSDVFFTYSAMPRSSITFVAVATQRILLRKVGGGSIFIHRLLLDDFANRGSSLKLQEILHPPFR